MPIANFELPTNICAGETIIIINNSSNADSYQWTIVKNSQPISIYTNTFAVGNLSYTFSEAGNYTIYLTASNSNGCANSTFSQNIDIQPFIDNHFSINNNSTPVFSFIPNTNTGTHNWNFGDGTVSNEINPQHEYLQSGTYTICHQIEGSCSTEHCETIDVCDLTADFINPNEICENTLTTFVSLNNNVSSYQWSVDGIVDVAANTQIFNKAFTAGEHIIGLSITDAFGCTSTKEMTITVLLEAVATFTVQNNNLTSTFTADYDDTTATYEWDFGDNTTGTGSTVSHTYSTDGTYMVNLTITNACGSVQSTQNGCGE